jgi:hypothetical protein
MPSRWMTFVSTLVSPLLSSLLSLPAMLLFGCGDDAGSGSGGGAQRSSGSANDAVGGGGAGGSFAGEACGWEGDDPGGLVATGNAVGDIIANVQGLTDQCGETRSLWDFAGGYRIVVLAEAW